VKVAHAGPVDEAIMVAGVVPAVRAIQGTTESEEPLGGATGAGYRDREVDVPFRRDLRRLLALRPHRAPSADDAAASVAVILLIAWTKLGPVPENESSLPWLLATVRNVPANQGCKRQWLYATETRMADEFRPHHGGAAEDGDDVYGSGGHPEGTLTLTNRR
jgi:hypothetical protein